MLHISRNPKRKRGNIRIVTRPRLRFGLQNSEKRIVCKFKTRASRLNNAAYTSMWGGEQDQLLNQHAGVADDPACVTGDIGAGGIGDAFRLRERLEAMEGFHDDDSRQNATHTNLILANRLQYVG